MVTSQGLSINVIPVLSLPCNTHAHLRQVKVVVEGWAKFFLPDYYQQKLRQTASFNKADLPAVSTGAAKREGFLRVPYRWVKDR